MYQNVLTCQARITRTRRHGTERCGHRNTPVRRQDGRNRKETNLENPISKEEKSMGKLPEVTRLSEITCWITGGRGEAGGEPTPQLRQEEKTLISLHHSLTRTPAHPSFTAQMPVQERKAAACLFQLEAALYGIVFFCFAMRTWSCFNGSSEQKIRHQVSLSVHLGITLEADGADPQLLWREAGGFAIARL